MITAALRMIRERLRLPASCIAALFCQHGATVRVGTACPPYGCLHLATKGARTREYIGRRTVQAGSAVLRVM